jgi:hypothetical protein
MAWKPGAAARYRVVVELGAARQEGGVAYTLKESGPDGVVLAVVATQLNQELRSEQVDGPARRHGQETLRLGERTFDCGVWLSRGRRGGFPSETRLWLRTDGGAPLRVTSKVEGQEELSLAAAALDDVVQAAGRDFRCARLDGHDVLKKQEVNAWYSPDVPGGLVRMISRGKAGGQDLSTTLELVSLVEKR